jgi:beta-glucanase (GH16 family)
MTGLARTWPAALGLAALGASLSGCTEDPGQGGWQLVWSDEFEGAAGAPPDPERWSAEVGGHGWGNRELQFYTDRPDNVALDGTGLLVITARREPMGGREFTSARLTSSGKFQQRYGRFEARLKLPEGRGFWPAFWMLGGDLDSVGWPACGEIDVVESRGAQPWRVSGALHGPGYSGGNALTGAFETADRSRLSDDFHLYAVEWEPGEIRFFVDHNQYHTVRASRLPPATRWPYDQPFFLLLNLAVGGNFGGPPDATTPFPQTLTADWVRVYR